jgi:Gas vesicle protein G
VNPFTFVIRLPLLPVRGVIRLATLIQGEAEKEMVNPVKIRRELEQVERARAAGQISDEQAAEFQRAAFAEFAEARRRPAAASGAEG